MVSEVSFDSPWFRLIPFHWSLIWFYWILFNSVWLRFVYFVLIRADSMGVFLVFLDLKLKIKNVNFSIWTSKSEVQILKSIFNMCFQHTNIVHRHKNATGHGGLLNCSCKNVQDSNRSPRSNWQFRMTDKIAKLNSLASRLTNKKN